ncbi:MAG: serine/threonine-protein kinase [Myxococcales bacterium]
MTSHRRLGPGHLWLRTLALSCALAYCALGARAVAQTRDVARAAEAFGKAQQAELRGDFQEAASFYALADELAPATEALRGAARSAQKGGMNATAATHAAALLERAPGDPNSRTLAEEILRTNEGELARLHVRCSQNCRVLIDGRMTASRQSSEHILFARPGTRDVSATFEGGNAPAQYLPLAAGVTAEVSFEAPSAVADATSTEQTAPAQSVPERKRLSAWYLGSAAVLTMAAAGLTVWSGLDVKSAHADYDRKSPTAAADYENGRSLEKRTDALIGVTAGLAVATATLAFFTDYGRRKQQDDRSHAPPKRAILAGTRAARGAARLVSLVLITGVHTMSKRRQDDLGTKRERLLGDYRILAELARGGMGRVYLARRTGQAGFERYFAIKVMHQQLNDDHNAVMMLLDEAHIASRLHHPNVVPVMDIGTFADGYYLVMDYVEGCSLQQLIKASPLERPVKAIVSIMLDALRGLHAVHTLRGVNDEVLHVVHRDISPHNLLLGLDGACRVTDFGIAKARQRFTDTDVGIHKGKLAFMSPEQLRGPDQVDARVDVWAAGVTLYAALTGVHPFRGENDAATVHALLGAEIPLPSSVGLKPPAALDEVIMRSLQRDPAERWASAEAFADALRDVALREGLLGSPGDVATWVKATCGGELAARRRRLLDIPKSDDLTVTEAERSLIGTSPSSSLPKLWFHGESGNTGSTSSPRITTENSWFAGRSSGVVAFAKESRTVLQAALVATALAAGALLAVTSREPAPQAMAQGASGSSFGQPAVVVTEHQASEADAPHPLTSPSSVDGGRHEARTSPPEPIAHASSVDDEPGTARRSPRALPPRPRKASPVIATPAPEPPAAAQAPVVAPESAPRPSPRAQPALDKNPYLLGE